MIFRRQRAEEVSINLTPLIDVVFLLLIFFMVSTTFTKETHMDLELPTSSSEATAVIGTPIEIVVSADGRFLINGQALVQSTLESLTRAVQLEMSADNAQAGIIIVADAKAPHQSVVYALDAAGQLGIAQVQLATRISGEAQ